MPKDPITTLQQLSNWIGASLQIPPFDRNSVRLTAEGLIGENFSRALIGGNALSIDGTAYFMAIGLRAGDVVANISIVIAAASATTTLSKVGLYSKGGTRLAVSADQAASWETAGLKTIAMIAPYTVLADDGFYLAAIAKASVTLPKFGIAQAALQVQGAGAIGSGMAAYGTQTAQTDLPASATITAGAPLSIWGGVS